MKKLLFIIASFFIISTSVKAQLCYSMPSVSSYIRYTGTHTSFLAVANFLSFDTTVCTYSVPPGQSVFLHVGAYAGQYILYVRNSDNSWIPTSFDSIDFYNYFTTDLNRLDPTWTAEKSQYTKWTDTAVIGAPVTGGKLMTSYNVSQSISSLQTSVNSRVPSSRAITINGVAQDMSSNRTWSVGDVFTTGSYSDPSFINTLSFSKLTGVPSFLTGITSSMVAVAQGYTSYNGTANPNGYVNSLSSFSTSNLAEGTNLYWTSGRFTTAFGTKSTTDLSEGANLYWTSTRFNTAFSSKTTTDLTEGSNLYWTTARFNSSLAAKSTSDLSEGSNKYYLDSRARLALSLSTTGTSGTATYNSTTGALNIPTYSAFNPSIPTSIAAGGRTIGTAYQVSSTNASYISVSISIACNLTLTSGSDGTATLEYSANGTTGWAYAGSVRSSNLGTLLAGINTTQMGGGQLSTYLPAGYYWHVVTTNNTATPTYTFLGGSYITYQ